MRVADIALTTVFVRMTTPQSLPEARRYPSLMSSDARPLTQEESRLLNALLMHDFPGAEALRAQTDGLLGKRGCDCGSGTIDLFPQGEMLPRSCAQSPAEVAGHVFDSSGEPIGGVVLWVTDGLLSAMEMYWYDRPFPTPALGQIKWQTPTSRSDYSP